ncbi:MAG: hypothetical protein AABM66_12140 [Actinomycetota bacterium]
MTHVREIQPVEAPPGTELVCDAPEDQRVEVVLAVDSFDQILNRRFHAQKLVEGVNVPLRVAERHRGERFELDQLDLDRLLTSESVELPNEAEDRAALDARVAELEAERREVEAEHERKREADRERALEIAADLAPDVVKAEKSEENPVEEPTEAEHATAEEPSD